MSLSEALHAGNNIFELLLNDEKKPAKKASVASPAPAQGQKPKSPAISANKDGVKSSEKKAPQAQKAGQAKENTDSNKGAQNQPRGPKPEGGVKAEGGRGGRTEGARGGRGGGEGARGGRGGGEGGRGRGDGSRGRGDGSRGRGEGRGGGENGRVGGEGRPPRLEGEQRNGGESRPEGGRGGRGARNGGEGRLPRAEGDAPRTEGGRGGRGGRGRGGFEGRPDRPYIRRDRPEGEGGERFQRPQFTEGGDQGIVGEEGSPQEYRDRPRFPRERRDRPAGERGGRGGREYERHSGTGRPMNDSKKRGAGRANWGTPGSELPAEGESVENVEAAVAADIAAPERPAGENAPQEPPKEDEDANKLTLNEYKQKQESELAHVPLPSVRKAGEGSAEDWSKFTPLSRDDAAAAKAAVKKEKKDASSASSITPKAKKEVVPVDKVLKQLPLEEKSGRGSRRQDNKPNPKKHTEAEQPTKSLTGDEFPALKSKAEAVKA